MSGLALPLIAKAVGPGFWSPLLYSLSLLCWLVLPFWYPYSVVKTGILGARNRVTDSRSLSGFGWGWQLMKLSCLL